MARRSPPPPGERAPMAGSGESRALFVVQRHFRRVRRGYDPEEVDRHLQLVSEWFKGSLAGQAARELATELDARERALDEAEEQRIETEAREILGRAEADAKVVDTERREILDRAEADGERIEAEARTR